MASSPRRGPNKPRQKSVKGEAATGSKWVGNNWEALAEAAKSNGGQVPYSISLVTSEFPNDKVWSEEYLPPILFYLTPPPSPYEGQSVGTFLREDGKRLRTYEVLPDRISVDVKGEIVVCLEMIAQAEQRTGWLLEAWRRLDPRISYEDIIDRMTADPEFCQGKGLTIPTKNSLQMHTLRSCRKLLGYWQLEGQKEEPSRAMVEAIERLTPCNLLYNTVLPLCTTYPNRLVRLKFERKTEDGQFRAVPLMVTPANVSITTMPLNFFSQHLNGNGFGLSVDRAWETLLILQERADIHGLSHWSKLHKNCRPISWQTRTKGAIPQNRAEDDKDGDDRNKAQFDSYDGGCSVCTWRPKSEATEVEDTVDSLKRPRGEESGGEPVARRLRSDTYDLGLSSESNCLIHSSPPAYLPAPRQDYGYFNPPPSTPLGYGNVNPMRTLNSSPPSFYHAPQPASQSTMSSSYVTQGMSVGSRPTPMSSQSGWPISNPGVMTGRSPYEFMQPPQARRQTVPSQFDMAYGDYHSMLPSMSRSFPDWSPANLPREAVRMGMGMGQMAMTPGQSWQRLPEVQRRTLDLQQALSSPPRHNAPRYGQSQEAPYDYRYPAYDRSNGRPLSHAPTPRLYSNKPGRRYEMPCRPKPAQHHDPMFTGPATPQYAYEPSISGSGDAGLSDSPLDALPNLDWSDDVFRMLLHSDEANEAPQDAIDALPPLPHNAPIQELGNQ
ncbi:hypothetical protein DV735_g3749, partial [Chaetothyriales sp. CBS 134920]